MNTLNNLKDTLNQVKTIKIMANKKPTQKEVVRRLFLTGPVTGSIAYSATKAKCKCGTLNLHVIIRELKRDGYEFQEPKWATNPSGWFKVHQLDRKKTPKKLLKLKD